MKSSLLIAGLLISLFAFSCQKAEKAKEETNSQMAVNELKADSIVRDTVTNADGVQLAMAFNNPAQTAMLVLRGETISLKQDLMASGIKYSNATYEYSEHQGEITLKKDGKVVFSARNK